VTGIGARTEVRTHAQGQVYEQRRSPCVQSDGVPKRCRQLRTGLQNRGPHGEPVGGLACGPVVHQPESDFMMGKQQEPHGGRDGKAKEAYMELGEEG
jgi:hypothetical protein